MAEGTLVADDSYYYFKIADNIAHGLGSSFDGISPTNGYHPLWLAVLIPVFGFVNQSIWIPVRLALTLSVCFDLISGLVIIQMLRSAGLNKEAQIASLFWFLSPFTLVRRFARNGSIIEHNAVSHPIPARDALRSWGNSHELDICGPYRNSRRHDRTSAHRQSDHYWAPALIVLLFQIQRSSSGNQEVRGLPGDCRRQRNGSHVAMVYLEPE